MTTLKLFDMPLKLLMEIYSKLPVNELIAKRSISKRDRLAADLVLFSKKNSQVIYYQTKLLMQWSDKSSEWFQSFFSGNVETFSQILFLSIQSSSSNPYHRLLGLRILGVIKNHSLSIDQDLASRLLHTPATGVPEITATLGEQLFTEYVSEITATSLVHETPSVRLETIKNLSDMSIIMKPGQRDLLITMAMGALNDTSDEVQQGAIRGLSKISNQMNLKQFTLFINRIIKLLGDNKSTVRLTAVKELAKFISKMNLEQLTSFIDKMNVCLDNKANPWDNESLMIRLTVLQHLSEMRPLNDKQATTLFADLSNIFGNNNSNQYMKALNILAKMASKFTPQQLNQFIRKNKSSYQDLTEGLSVIASGLNQPELLSVLLKALNKMLGYKDLDSRRAALDNLSKLVDKMKLKSRQKFINAITEALSDQNLEMRQSALENFPTIANTINSEQLNTFIIATIDALNAADSEVRQAGLKNFSTIASKGTQEQLSTFITGAIRALTDLEPHVCKTSMQALKVLNNKMNADELKLYTAGILTILNNPAPVLAADTLPHYGWYLHTTVDPLKIHHNAFLSLFEIINRIKDPEQLKNLRSIFIKALNTQNPEICQGALKVLMEYYLQIKLIEKPLPFISQVLFKALNNQFEQVSKTAQHYLSELCREMKSEQISPFINQVVKALEDKGMGLRQAALKSLPIIANKMNSNELTTSINLTIEILHELAKKVEFRGIMATKNIYDLVLETLSKMTNELNSEQHQSLIDAAIQMISVYRFYGVDTLQTFLEMNIKMDVNQLTMLITAATSELKEAQAIEVLWALSDFFNKKEVKEFALFFNLAIKLLTNTSPDSCMSVLKCLETTIEKMESEQLKLFIQQLNEKLNSQNEDLRNCASNIISRLIVCNQYEITDRNEQAELYFEGAVLRNLLQMNSQFKALSHPNKKRPTSTSAAEYEETERSTLGLWYKQRKINEGDDSEENQNAMQL